MLNYLAMDYSNQNQIEIIVNDETRRLVGYVMPVLESMNASQSQKIAIKKILYTHKNKVCELLNNEMSNDKHNQ
jgi:hypothetical protein